MEEMMKQPPHSTSASSSELAMHRDSRVISKFKPKIRIIHIYAPEIIKTDAANFRELVQRLTGKPAEEKKMIGTTIRNITKTPPSVTMEMHNDHLFPSSLQNAVTPVRIKEEEEEGEEIWRSGEKFNAFFDGFSDLDGFIEELIELPVH